MHNLKFLFTCLAAACAGLGTAQTAVAGPMSDAADIILEGDLIAVRERLHEVIPGLPVRVFTMAVQTEVKGSVPERVEIVLPGGTSETGSLVEIVGNPRLEVGDHVLIFCRVRTLGGEVSVTEPNALRLAHQAGLYRRAAASVDGGPFLTEDGRGRPLPLEQIDGSTPSGRPALPADDETPVARPAIVQAEWSSVVSAVLTEVASSSRNARPPITIADEVAP